MQTIWKFQYKIYRKLDHKLKQLIFNHENVEK